MVMSVLLAELDTALKEGLKYVLMETGAVFVTMAGMQMMLEYSAGS